ncbi:hypothetical protein [Arthrobacter sp. RIT-PI-e]|uniref:hypothetical protein n=1 Tax=Arthrobacter sp. RIT-PI-e TaxID=1681197 RepID=UPI00067662A2|nr:hypothetical protein [Arthrobacter sp. RIT-PI-e]
MPREKRIKEQDPQQGSARAGAPGKEPEDATTARAESARLWLRVFLLSLLGALLTSGLPLPWKVLGLALGLFALTAGVVALVKAVRADLPRFLVVTVCLGLFAALFMTAGSGASVILWPVTQQYETCQAEALTLRAERQCEDELRDLGGLLPGGTGR